jgi:predicted small secreted protein
MMKMVIAGVIAAAVVLGANPTRAAGFDVQTEGNIFLNEVAQIPQLHDPAKFRRVVRMRFDMFTLAYTTNTPIFSGKKFDVLAHLTNENYERAAQVVKLMLREQPLSTNPALGMLRNIVEDCASSSRCNE